jgi:hypothetical protein
VARTRGGTSRRRRGRKPTAPPAASAGGFAAAAEACAAAAERALADGGAAGVADGAIERVLTAAVKLYAAKAEAQAGTPRAPVAADRVTPTEVVTVVSEMLRAVDVSLFDLAMWYRRGGA